MKEQKLSEEFLTRMRDLLGEQGFKEYLASFEKERHYGLRVNCLKISPERFQTLSSLTLEAVPWIFNGFYYEGEARPAKDPYYYAGLYYLQEPSAMTPANLLPIEPGDRVLDLCAAPGGKSTELGARLKGKGILVSNDISSSRARALLKNLQLWGIENVCVASEEPKRLSEAFGAFFDKILVDAPCSGEGMFRKDEKMIASYEERGPEYYEPIQKEILEHAVSMLRPGGLLMYSTCTFSACEDEEVIAWILERHKELRLIPLPLFPGADDGIGLSGCLRLFPHRIKGEGHFMALLKKEGESSREESRPKRKAKTSLPSEVSGFLSMIRRDFDLSRIEIRNDRVLYLPEFLPPLKLRFLCSGLALGELKNNRFEPGQALAMALKKEEFKQTVSFSREDERVIRYLKGETISLKEGEALAKGWSLVCVDGFPLGFAKGAGMTLKNKYYPGWRWQ